VARPQILDPNAVCLDGDPFDGLIRIDEINAQRAFSDPSAFKEGGGPDSLERKHSEKRRISEQLRDYYRRHIDPSESPEATDIDALEAICRAQNEFDKKLHTGFSAPLREVEGMGYPGFSDPTLVLSTKLHPVDGLNHSSALQYEVIFQNADEKDKISRLPEHYNGLGYQNLISMVFRLMSFRDAWMQVGKARKKDAEKEEFTPPPLHLVLIEEPEAHLHVQVQQVFIRKAYEILRKHADLGVLPYFSTQLVVSTHSSHIAHECEFSMLRYFRRRPALKKGEVPTSTVINLTEVFGDNDHTKKFVVRYLRATHCDLFFADAAILVEGPAERMLVPNFIRSHYRELDKSYVTLLEIGGSHAHRLAPLINKLQLITLVITDLDSCEATAAGNAAQPQRGRGLVTGNSTLKGWVPKKTLIDELFDLPEAAKELTDGPFFAVRAAYQKPVQAAFKGQTVEALPYTFEDALVFQNLDMFKALAGTGLIGKFHSALDTSPDLAELSKKLFDFLRAGADKAGMALDILMLENFNDLKVPAYIDEGLIWLEKQIKQKHVEILQAITTATVEAGASTPPTSPASASNPTGRP
jgi:predicted ATP-dependent endonuclease of OLD family